MKEVERWVGEHEISYKEHVTDGLENAIHGFIGMLRGDNFGKAVIKVSE
jgi:NADPH-dependent curcumin reductase